MESASRCLPRSESESGQSRATSLSRPMGRRRDIARIARMASRLRWLARTGT